MLEKCSLALTLICAVLSMSSGGKKGESEHEESPTSEIPADAENWMETHEEFVKRSRELGDKIKIVFIGSSSIERWGSTGLGIWKEKYARLGAYNYGISGDRTQNVLWRIGHGELDGLSPTLVILYIGSNNIPDPVPVNDVLKGVKAVIKAIRAKLPKTKILYNNFFPRLGPTPETINERWRRILEVNGKMERMDFGDDFFSLDFFWHFAETWGVLKEELYENDKLHLNGEGYAKWDSLWNATLSELLDEDENSKK